MPWRVLRDGRVVCQILNPVAQWGAYVNRSISGRRAKDEAKLHELEKVIMPSGRLEDIPTAYREQYFAFQEQFRKAD